MCVCVLGERKVKGLLYIALLFPVPIALRFSYNLGVDANKYIPPHLQVIVYTGNGCIIDGGHKIMNNKYFWIYIITKKIGVLYNYISRT